MESGSQGSTAPSAAPADRDLVERRKVIKNKILAVGRMAHFFSLLRCVAAAAPFVVSTVLTVRQRGIGAGIGAQEYLGFVKTAIRHARARRRRNQERHQDLRRRVRPTPYSLFLCPHRADFYDHDRRKSDIENERLPPIDERQPPPASSNAIPGASANLGQSVSASAAPRANAVVPPPVTTFKRPKDGKAQRR